MYWPTGSNTCRAPVRHGEVGASDVVTCSTPRQIPATTHEEVFGLGSGCPKSYKVVANLKLGSGQTSNNPLTSFRSPPVRNRVLAC